MTPARTTFALLTAIAVTVCAATFAQSVGPPPAFDIPWHSIDSGGGKSTSATFEVVGAIGQHDAATDALTSATFSVSGGFLPGAGSSAPPCPADIAPPSNGDGLVNADDLLAVIENWGPCPIPPAGCPNNIVTTGVSATQVDTNDLLAVIINWGACP